MNAVAERWSRPGGVRLTAAALGASLAVALLARWGPDWPAQEFRALIARSHPLALWANNWFSGQPLGGYSLLYPLLAGAVGAAVVGVASVVGAAWAAGQLLPRVSPRAAVALEAAVVLSLASSLLQGQLPYLLGTAFGLAALAADRHGRRVPVAVLAALCSLSSPLAAFFLVMAAAATTATRPVRRLAPYGTAAAGFVVPLILGGASGPNPYPVTSALGALAFAACLVVAFPGTSTWCRVLRRFGVLYAIAALLLLPVANPIGGNIARVGMQLAMPLACLALQQRSVRRGLVALGAVLATVWSMLAPISSIAHGAHNPSQQRAYFVPLLRYFDRARHNDGQRVEIPMTQGHWETSWVASSVPLARGWERQTDIQHNRLFYSGTLTAGAYRRWLDQNAVGWVALPDVPLDTGGVAEGRLLQHPPSWLRPVWHNAHWRVWKVTGAPAIASGPARLTHLGETTIVLRFSRPGTSLVRVRAAALWHVARGEGCVSAAPSGWMRVTTGHTGRVVLSTTLFAPATTNVCRAAIP